MNGPDGDPLPELSAAVLSKDLLEQLLGDLRDHAVVISIRARGAPGKASSAVDLDEVPRLLQTTPGAAVQIKYRHEGRMWLDTLSACDEGTKLVRMQQA